MDYLLKLSLAGGTYWCELLLWWPCCFACLALWAALWHRRWWHYIRGAVFGISLAAGVLICACRIGVKLIDEGCRDQNEWLPSQLLDFSYAQNSSAAGGTLFLLVRLARSLGEAGDTGSQQQIYRAFELEMLNPSRHHCSGVLEPQKPAAVSYEQLPVETQQALDSFIHAPDGGNLMTEEEKQFVHQSLMDCCRSRILSASAAYYRPKLERNRPLYERLQGGIVLMAVLSVLVIARRDIRTVPPCIHLEPSRASERRNHFLKTIQ